jgi:hypothetical protein
MLVLRVAEWWRHHLALRFVALARNRAACDTLGHARLHVSACNRSANHASTAAAQATCVRVVMDHSLACLVRHRIVELLHRGMMFGLCKFLLRSCRRHRLLLLGSGGGLPGQYLVRGVPSDLALFLLRQSLFVEIHARAVVR